MTIECVSIENCHLFDGNPLAEQFKLRYRCVIERQNWKLPVKNDLEYDDFDNPATTYLVWRDRQNIARGLARLYPTDRPFMIEKSFADKVSYQPVPRGNGVLEGSRFCIDKAMDSTARKQIARELVLSYLEYGVHHHTTQIIGIMYPVYWRSLFAKNGWDPEWLGDEFETSEGMKARVATLPVSAAVLYKVREVTGIYQSVINYGNSERVINVSAA